MELGPGVVVAKRGEYGAALFSRDQFFAIPGYLLEDVRDPTGAGDSFAGGFLGYLDSRRAAGDSVLNPAVLRRAMAYGSVLASFNVEDFGTERVRALTREEIEERLRDFRRITHFEVEPVSGTPARS
jgi:sugar/nucleoside kinase (ribokinase family)